MSDYASLFDALNAPGKAERLNALKGLMELENKGIIPPPQTSAYVNNHIHTIYSFSPYSPSKALWMARKAGLVTAGIIDHDSVGGCDEFVQAGEITGMAATCGFECRVDFSGTPLEGRRINNPDQCGIAYITFHGIPHQNIPLCEEFLAPYRRHRNERNRKMVAKLNKVVAPLEVSIDFDRDVVPLSRNADGGSITERHILFALSNKLVRKFGKSGEIPAQLKSKLHMHISSKNEKLLSDPENPYLEYDLLGALKSDLVAAFYIDAKEECPHVSEFIRFAQKAGGISAYAYLGDVVNSVTGDKKAQKFEDDYIDRLFDTLGDLHFNAVTYMPSRNTMEQLKRVMNLCEKHGFFEISGEDINTPRQSFICEALNKPEFQHLSVATWALIGHEREATADLDNAMFSEKTQKTYPALRERIRHYAQIAKK